MKAFRSLALASWCILFNVAAAGTPARDNKESTLGWDAAAMHYEVHTDQEIHRAVNTTAGNAVIVVCADIMLKSPLMITDKSGLVFRSAYGRQFLLSGRGQVQIMILQGASNVLVFNLTLSMGYSTGTAYINAGGAVTVFGANTSFEARHVTFYGSESELGGAVACSGGAFCRFLATNFTKCHASLGGGIFLFGNARAQVVDSTFDSCRAVKNAGAVYAESEAVANFTRVAFSHCTAEAYSGAVYLAVATRGFFDSSSFHACTTFLYAGAIYAFQGSEAVLQNCTFASCRANYGGAVMLNDASRTAMTGVLFTSCVASVYGGAIVVNVGSSATLLDVVIDRGSANKGGGVNVADDSWASFTNTTFKLCTARFGGAVNVFGGSATTFADVSASDNRASDAGGFFYQETDSTAHFARGRFHRNAVSAGDGGSVFSVDSNLVLVSCLVTDSAAHDRGGAIFSTGNGVLEMVDSNVTNASSAGAGGALHRLSYAADSSALLLANCTFVSCSSSAGAGGAVFAAGNIGVTLRNSSFRKCTAGAVGGGVAIEGLVSAAGGAAASTFQQSHFIECEAVERGGAVAISRSSAAIDGCAFVGCRIAANADASAARMLLTMKTLNTLDMWSGAVLFVVPSSRFESLSLTTADLACSQPNQFCSWPNQKSCKCQCGSRAEEILRNESIANFTMDCAAGDEETDNILVDASTDGTSFVIVVTQGYYPFATEWTLGTDSNPDEYVSDGKANQIRGSIEPFEQLQSASNGYGGGALFINDSASVAVLRCTFVETCAEGTGGGAIFVESEEGSSLAASSTMQTVLRVTSSTFRAASAYLGTTLYNSLANVVFEDSFVAPDGGDPSNRFFDADQTAQCASLCPEGSFGNCSLLGASCASCEIGQCISCPPGRTGISQVTGSTSMEEGCRICPEGYAAAAAGTVESCFKCSKGTFAADSFGDSTKSSAVQCKMCEANTYNPYDGSTNCLQCPLQQITSAPGASRCDRAVEGYYVPDPTAVNPVAKKCPRHASCAGGHFLPSPKKGFWSDPTSSTSAAAKIYECTRDTCTGAKGNHSCWTATNMDTEGCNIDDILCKRGSEGPLCGSCSSSFSFNQISSNCEHCGGSLSASETTLIIAFFMLALAVFFFMISPWQSARKIRTLAFGLLRGFDRGSLKICWNTFQIVSSIPFSSNVEFPEPFATWLQGLSFMSFDFLSSDCVFLNQSYAEKVYILCFLPLILAALLVLGCAVWSKRHPASHDSINKKWLPYSLLLLSYCILPPIAAKLFVSLDCISIDGSRYLRADTSINCDKTSFQHFEAFLGMFIAMYLCIPLVWVFLIYRVRQQLNPTTRDHATFDEDTAALRFLLADYRQHCEYTECLEMFRRIMFIGVVPLMAQEAEKKCFIGMVFSIVSIIVYNETTPFELPMNNIIAKGAQYVILVTYGSAAAIESGATQGLNSTIFGLILVGVNAVLVFLVAYLALVNVRDHNRFQWAPLVTGAKYHFFLSFKQSNSGDQCASIRKDLNERCFKVYFAGDTEDAGFAEGADRRLAIAESEVFLLFVNVHTLRCVDVRASLSEALRLEKRIVVVYETDSSFGAPLDDDGLIDLEKCFLNERLESKQSATPSPSESIIGVAELSAAPPPPKPLLSPALHHFFFESSETKARIIPYMRRSPFREAMIATLLDQADMSHIAGNLLGGNEESKSVVALPPLPNYFVENQMLVRYHAVIASGALGLNQRDELVSLLRKCCNMAVFERQDEHTESINGCDYVAGISHSCVLIVILTDHVLEDPRVQAQIREAKTLDRPILFVYETEKIHGAPLSRDKAFDFERVVWEQAPADLKTLYHSVEHGIPYQRRRDITLQDGSTGVLSRFVDAMLDAIVKQAAMELRGLLVHEGRHSIGGSQWSRPSDGSFSNSSGGIRMVQSTVNSNSRPLGAYSAAPRHPSSSNGDELRSLLLGSS